ncbi:MAG: MarR family transcriptional regulator [Alphaproteobacteria bacterium]|nr:MarR family transcriptional regulator [Alphaproteobacteria bacterium]
MDEQQLTSELALQAIEVCLCFHTRKASRAVTQVFDHILAPTGLKTTQLSLLMVVNARTPLRIGDLADALVSDSTTVSRTIKPLIKRGLLLETPDKRDRRVKLITLTDSGRAALERALPLWQTAQSQVAKGLGSGLVQNLLPALEAVAHLGPSDSF